MSSFAGQLTTSLLSLAQEMLDSTSSFCWSCWYLEIDKATLQLQEYFTQSFVDNHEITFIDVTAANKNNKSNRSLKDNMCA